MMMNALINYHALSMYARIPVLFLMTPAVIKLCARCPLIGQFVNVLMVGQEILILNAINVRYENNSRDLHSLYYT